MQIWDTPVDDFDTYFIQNHITTVDDGLSNKCHIRLILAPHSYHLSTYLYYKPATNFLFDHMTQNERDHHESASTVHSNAYL